MPYDERDVIFARMNYEKGSENYQDYYQRRPEKERMDKITRMRPLMGDKRSAQYNPLVTGMVDGCFDFLDRIKPLVDGPINPEKIPGTPEQFTELLTGLATYYGAKHVGIAPLSPADYYTHKGRPNEIYDQEIEPTYEYAIVFSVEMDEKLVDTAPYVTESVATTKGYVDTAIIGMVLSHYIRQLGYEARNNMDGNYLFPLPPLAQKAGLGEMGLHGLLITPDLGPRIRLGAVSTNIPLVATQRKPLGIRAFCEMCHRCEKGCVTHAIQNETQGNEHGFYDNVCLAMWQRYGSDCGVCLSACPFAHHMPQVLVDNLMTKEGRVALAEYYTQHYGQRVHNYDRPAWLDAAYPPKKEK